MKNKSTLLNALTIIAYCFCAAIAIVWISIIVAFAMGYYTPEKIYAENLYVDNIDENSKVEIINGVPVLRINGITESDNPNVPVDATFVVRGGTTPTYDDEGNIIDENEVTETKIYLTSSNPDVATVPAEGDIGEPIHITVTKDNNGHNRGGFCLIYVENDEGKYMSTPLVVFVDIPVESLTITSDDMNTVIEDEIQKFTLYQDEVAQVDAGFYPNNSLDPSHLDTNSRFNSYRKNPKTVEYYLDENSPQDVISIDQNGRITALKPGEVTVIARTLRTYDDIDFVNNYDSGVPELGDYIPPELLVGRYTETSFVIKVEEITLEAIDIDGRDIPIELFETISMSPADLGIALRASNGNNDYFSSLLNDLVLTTDSKGLLIKKNNDTNEWEFTVEQEPQYGFEVYVSLPDYPTVTAVIDNFIIDKKDISQLSFEGTSKSNESVSYNDLVEINITKSGSIITSQNYTWDWTNNVEIVPEMGNAETSYFLVKVFAIGTYHNNSEYRDARFVNEQGEEIIQLSSTVYEGFGREVRGMDLTNPEVVQALARGSIVLRAYVVKTDMYGNPIDQNGNIMRFDQLGNAIDEEGNIIVNNVPSFVEIARSNDVTFRIIEQMTDLETYVTVESTGEETLIGSTQTSATAKILAVSSVSTHQISLLANSNGALFDAFNNMQGNEAWIRVVNNDTDTLTATLEEVNLGDTAQNYYLNLDIHAYNSIEEYIERDIRIEYYTGNYNISSDGYETLFTLRLYIIEVPVESIHMNVNAEVSDTVNDINCYWLSGLLNYSTEIVNGRQEVSALTSQWGTVSSTGVMTEFTLSQPTFVAGEIQVLQNMIEGVDYLRPKTLTIANTGYTYKITDANGNETPQVARVVSTTVGNENVYRLYVQELNTEFYIVLSATYEKYENGVRVPITDTICVSGTLTEAARNSIEWQTNDGEYSTTASVYELNQNEQGGGYALRNNSLFSLRFVGASSIGEDIWVSSTSQFIQFEVASDTASLLRLIDGNQEDGITSLDTLVFYGQPLDSVEAHINVVLTTQDGLKIRQQYTINFS